MIVVDSVPIVVEYQTTVVLEMRLGGQAQLEPSIVFQGTSDNCPLSYSDPVYFYCATFASFPATFEQQISVFAGGEERNVSTTVFVDDPHKVCDVCIPDTVPPNITCLQEYNMELPPSGQQSINASELLVSVFEDCSEYQSEVSPNAFDCDMAGNAVPVVVNVTDVAGNVAECVVMVHVIDPDNDGDGSSVAGCFDGQPDCDDTDSSVFPGNNELCDGLDQDCDLAVDEGLATDTDSDGFTTGCTTDPEHSGDIDCDDQDPNNFPFNAEVCDNRDQDCDGFIDEGLAIDQDGDGFSVGCETDPEHSGDVDCDDQDPNNFPFNAEVCDNRDQDCDGFIDEGLAIDQDGDGFSVGCETDPEHSGDVDCDDQDPNNFPFNAEVCDDRDQDCDGFIDEGLAIDQDGDGFSVGCETDPEHSGDIDCDDQDPNNFPFNAEVCDDRDQDCDGFIDEGLAIDQDGDGFSVGCETDPEHSGDIDCDDQDPNNFPFNAEVCDDRDQDCDGFIDEGLAIDQDGDGFSVGCETDPEHSGDIDCDDQDPNNFPFNAEVCDNRDQDCDGFIDEGLAIDQDGDGFSVGCETDPEHSGDVDCDDQDPNNFPFNAEVCDNRDQDCDGFIDEGLAIDQDGDGFSVGCETDPEHSGDVDCDDQDPNNFPFNAEVCDDRDQDCDGFIDEGLAIDQDGDGFSVGCETDPEHSGDVDCDDQDPNNFPFNAEVCDNRDQDCDGFIDEGLAIDQDGDGFSVGCETDPEHSGDVDCDDQDPNNFPFNAEVCDDRDQDCDGFIDEGLALDSDSDGFSVGCETDESNPILIADCNDSDASVYPGQAETCDGRDEDCDQIIDEGLALDADGDQHAVGCLTDSTNSLPIDDCNDQNGSIHPGQQEVCDSIDQDCDELVDEGLGMDNDSDNHGDPQSCLSDETLGGIPFDDCDDANGSVYPGAQLIRCNGVDESCNGNDDDDGGNETSGHLQRGTNFDLLNVFPFSRPSECAVHRSSRLY